ncbi:MAG: hypothetical protein SGCHY_005437, partial [Lobulomycetales sp.]
MEAQMPFPLRAWKKTVDVAVRVYASCRHQVKRRAAARKERKEAKKARAMAAAVHALAKPDELPLEGLDEGENKVAARVSKSLRGQSPRPTKAPAGAHGFSALLGKGLRGKLVLAKKELPSSQCAFKFEGSLVKKSAVEIADIFNFEIENPSTSVWRCSGALLDLLGNHGTLSHGKTQIYAYQIVLGLEFLHDWWSLGVVLYTMQTGKYPFGEEDETDHLQILKSIQKDQVVLPISLDVDYRSIVHQLLNKNPSTRLGAGESGDGQYPYEIAECDPNNLHAPSAPSASVCLGDFKILNVVGEGGYGKVMLARDKITGSYYAIKAIRKDTLVEYGDIDSAKQENRIFRAVQNPFVVSLHSSFQNEQYVFYVMEYVAG